MNNNSSSNLLFAIFYTLIIAFTSFFDFILLSTKELFKKFIKTY